MRIELVGRDAELAALDEALELALAGATQVVLCRGEPGIGKTRLAEEACGRAAVRGFRALWGTGVEDDGAPPFWPWQQVLRGLAESCDVAALGRALGLTGELAMLAPDVFPAGSGRPPRAAPAEERFRQFDAVARLLGDVTLHTPLLIVLDDAQWAGPSSLRLLQHVVRTVRQGTLLLLVTWRSTDHRRDARGRPPLAAGQRPGRRRAG